MTKIVYNNCFGGFGLSKKAVERYFELMGWGLVVVNEDHEWEYYHRQHSGEYFYPHDLERDDPILVQVVEELGSEANAKFSELAIRELPAGTRYRIDEYHGNESVITDDEQGWRIAR